MCRHYDNKGAATFQYSDGLLSPFLSQSDPADMTSSSNKSWVASMIHYLCNVAFDVCLLSGHLSPPTRLLPIAGLQLLLDNPPAYII